MTSSLHLPHKLFHLPRQAWTSTLTILFRSFRELHRRKSICAPPERCRARTRDKIIDGTILIVGTAINVPRAARRASYILHPRANGSFFARRRPYESLQTHRRIANAPNRKPSQRSRHWTSELRRANAGRNPDLGSQLKPFSHTNMEPPAASIAFATELCGQKEIRNSVCYMRWSVCDSLIQKTHAMSATWRTSSP